MTTFTTSFETGVVGGAIGTTTGSGGDAFTAGFNGTGTAFVTDSTATIGGVAHGSLSGKMTIPATPAGCWRGWTITGPQSFRIYVYLTTFPGTWDVIQALVAAGPTNVARLRITATGQLQHVNGSTAGTATTGVIPLNKLVRIEGTWSTATTATGTFTVEAYLANGTTPIANTSISLTGLAFPAVADQLRFGFPVTGLANATVYFDGWGVSNTGRLGPITNPGMSTLVDDFATKDPTKWFYDTSASQSAGQALLVPTSSYNSGIFGNLALDLTNDAFSVKIVQPPNIGSGTTELQTVLYAGDDKMFFNINNGNLAAFQKVGGVQNVVGSVIAYNATTMKYLRIRHNGSQVVWEYSGDGWTWTPVGSWTPTIAVTALKPLIIAGYYGTETTPGTAIVDDVNIVPPLLATETWTGTTGAAWPAQWTTSADTATGAAVTIDTNRGRLVSTSGGTFADGNLAYLAGMPATADTDITVDVSFPSPATSQFLSIYARMPTAPATAYAAPTSAYRITIAPNEPSIYIRKSVAGTSTDLANPVTTAWTANVSRRVRFQVIGSTLRVKIWDPASAAEPGTWLSTVTDTSVTAPGRVAFKHFNGSAGGNVTAYVDNLTISNSTTPVHVADYLSELANTTTHTASVTCATGDLLIYSAWTGTGANIPQAPSGGGLTWTQQIHANGVDTAGNSEISVWTATATASTTFTLTGTTTVISGGPYTWQFQVQRWMNAQVGSSKWSISGSTTAQITFTPTASNSALVMYSADFNAVSGASRTYLTASAGAFTETFYGTSGTAWTTYGGYYANHGAAGSKTVGLSAPTGQLAAMGVLELVPVPQGLTITVWNGTTETAVTLDGVWNGTSIVTGVTFKLWNGTAEV